MLRGGCDMNRAEAIVRKGEQRRGFVPYWLRFMGEIDVDFLEAYERIYELTAVRKGALPPKFREMIVCAAVAIGGYGPRLGRGAAAVGAARGSGARRGLWGRGGGGRAGLLRVGTGGGRRVAAPTVGIGGGDKVTPGVMRPLIGSILQEFLQFAVSF